ncbi:MAG: dephospho-CoA kinase [Longimicrobiales bacterium]|nr:dephospho-CoA kinase [Longimicrobiales bacterium]
MLDVALTGNVASGKSTVAARWRSLGVPVISADDLAREAVEPGSEGLVRVVDVFGEEVLTEEGRLDRGALRHRVFRDEDARRRLEEIIHPIVWRLRDDWLAERRAEGAELAVSEIPLLFETGREGDVDAVVLVDAPEEVRLERLVTHRDLDPREARRIIESQMDTEVKRSRSDFVVDNIGTPRELEVMADRILAQLRARAGARTIKMDLHLHTRGSWDCLSDPESVLERATALGYHRIAITDHDAVHVALRMAEAHPDRIVPGEEVKTAEGIDIIGLYLSELIPGGTPAEETIRRIRDQGGIPYLPHPYAGGKGAGEDEAERLADLCDVVEVFNARIHDQRLNEKADDLATRHGKLRSAGSDAHTLGELGHAYVVLPEHPNNAEGLRAALARGRTGGRESSRLVHLASTWAKLRKKLP